MKEFTLKEIKDLIPNSEILNTNSPEEIRFTSIAPLSSKKENFLSFLSSRSHLSAAKSSKATALIANKEIASTLTCPLLIVENVELELGKILEYIYPSRKPDGKISPTAFVDPTAKIGEGTSLGHYVTVGANSILGKNCIIEDGVKIGDKVIIGDNARIAMNCVFATGTEIGNNFVVFGNSTFGGDGFKFVSVHGVHHKIPHIGKVVIGNDVEIGSNCAVDKGGLEDTIIGDGCKFDNMVHIAHNVKLGKNIIIAGQSGIAGSSIIGDGVIIGGGCSIRDHIEIAAGTMLGGGTSVRASIKKPDVYLGFDWGFTAAEFLKAAVNMRQMVHFNKWMARIKAMEKKLGIIIE